MIAILNILIFLIFLLFVVGLNYRMLRQVKGTPITEASIILLIFLLGVNILSFSMTTGFYAIAQQISSFNLTSVAYGILSFSSIAISVMIKMQMATAKKMRTLIRLPIIGALVGFYLKDERVLYLFIGIELLLTIYFFINKNLYNYTFRQQAKAFFGIILFFILVTVDLYSVSLIGLFIFILMKNQIINQIRLKLVLEKSQNDT